METTSKDALADLRAKRPERSEDDEFIRSLVDFAVEWSALDEDIRNRVRDMSVYGTLDVTETEFDSVMEVLGGHFGTFDDAALAAFTKAQSYR